MSQEKTNIADEIVARKIMLVDGKGAARICLGVDESDSPYIAVLDDCQRDAIFMTVDRQGRSFITMRKRDGVAIATLTCDRDGVASIRLIDGGSGVPAIVFSVDGDGKAAINCEFQVPDLPI